VLATKVYGEMGEWPNESRLSALHIRRACDESLRRLQTDHIDLYQMHHVYRPAAWDEIWQAFETLVLQGKVLYVGSSNGLVVMNGGPFSRAAPGVQRGSPAANPVNIASRFARRSDAGSDTLQVHRRRIASDITPISGDPTLSSA
jgi:aryl-alcohol dehydrogenase-like predicted oxidoreductase